MRAGASLRSRNPVLLELIDATLEIAERPIQPVQRVENGRFETPLILEVGPQRTAEEPTQERRRPGPRASG